MTTVCVGCGLEVVDGQLVNDTGGYSSAELISYVALEQGNGTGVFDVLSYDSYSGRVPTGWTANSIAHKYLNAVVTNPDPCQRQLVVTYATIGVVMTTGAPSASWAVAVGIGFDSSVGVFTTTDFENIAANASTPFQLVIGPRMIKDTLAPGQTRAFSYRIEMLVTGNDVQKWDTVGIQVDAFSIPIHP